jgi:hypothetical protein
LKDLYEAEFPQTKKGVAGAIGSNKAQGNNAKTDSVFAPSFVKDTATKTNKSETTIKEEIQVATNIPKKVQAIIKDLPRRPKKVFREISLTGKLPLSRGFRIRLFVSGFGFPFGYCSPSSSSFITSSVKSSRARCL